MSKSIQQIERDLAEIRAQVSELKISFSEKYQQYFDLLSKIAKQQLVLSSYQICTEFYPKAFLELPAIGRQKLQDQIREYANSIERRISKALDFSHTDDQTDEPAKVNEYLQNVQKPLELMIWSQNVSHKIHQIFNHYSNLVNICLLENRILPDHLPRNIIDMSAEHHLEAINGYPELVRVHAHNEESIQENKESSLNNVVIVNLKVGVLEFNNPALEREHQQLKALYDRLKILSQTYIQREQELLIAQSQAAWRSLWYDT
jgi:hypothetical protein